LSTIKLPQGKKRVERIPEIEKSLDGAMEHILKRINKSKNLAKRAGVEPSAVTRFKKSTDFEIAYRILYALNDGPPNLFPSQDDRVGKALRIIESLLTSKD
jgi:hypothetical protein